MAAARNTRRLDEQLSRWTNGLKTMMLDGHRFATEQSKHVRDQSRAGQMHNVRRSDLLPQLKKAGPPKNAKRKPGVIEVSGWRLRDNRDLEFRQILGVNFGEASRHCQDDGFGPAHARSEIVRVE
jgi:hypothetical protein